MKEPDEDEDESNCFPSHLKLATFADLYDILIQMFNDHAANVRMAVILALKHVCKYPGLVGALKMDLMYSPSQSECLYNNHSIVQWTSFPCNVLST